MMIEMAAKSEKVDSKMKVKQMYDQTGAIVQGDQVGRGRGHARAGVVEPIKIV